MCTILKNDLLHRGKYLPVAQLPLCQDKPQGISLLYSNFVWILTWSFQQRVFAKLKILLLSKTEISPKKEKHPHCRGYSHTGSELRHKRKRTHMLYNSFHTHRETGASLGRDSQGGTGSTGPASAGPTQPVHVRRALPALFSCCFRSQGLMLWPDCQVWEIENHFFPREL